jgi:hypothetical protein
VGQKNGLGLRQTTSDYGIADGPIRSQHVRDASQLALAAPAEGARARDFPLPCGISVVFEL